ncbi:unnamed protein product [Lampetra planeri]
MTKRRRSGHAEMRCVEQITRRPSILGEVFGAFETPSTGYPCHTGPAVSDDDDDESPPPSSAARREVGVQESKIRDAAANSRAGLSQKPTERLTPEQTLTPTSSDLQLLRDVASDKRVNGKRPLDEGHAAATSDGQLGCRLHFKGKYELQI